jgi:AAA domain
MEKTKVIFIYGTPAVGKLTTAKLLAAKEGYKLLHNHLTTDLVRAIFERGNPRGDMYLASLRLEVLGMAVKEKVQGVVMTGVYARDFIYPNGESDEWFVKQLEKITEDNGGEFYGINLITDRGTLSQRVKEEDRRTWGKIHNEEILEGILSKHDYTKTAPIKNNIIIDNTDFSAEEVAQKIQEFIQ